MYECVCLGGGGGTQELEINGLCRWLRVTGLLFSQSGINDANAGSGGGGMCMCM